MAKRNLLSSHRKPNASMHGDFRPWRGKIPERTRQRKLLTLIDDESLETQCRLFFLKMKRKGIADSTIMVTILEELIRIKRLDLLEKK